MARTTPSYKGLRPASSTASRVHARSSRSDTKCEVSLRRELWRRGLRFQKLVQGLPGRPDIVFKGALVAIFCDGDFWHGKDWARRRARLERGTNATYWTRKIETNMARDAKVNEQLRSAGWCVLRFWESEIKSDTARVADEIESTVQMRRSKRTKGRQQD